MEISFTYPNYLFLLAVIPLIVMIYFISLRYKGNKALKFANFGAIARIKGIDIYSKNITILLMTIIISSLIVLSLSGMNIQGEITSSEFSYVIAVDSSRSMEARDMVPNRMDVAKSTAKEFVDSLPIGAKIGIVSFSGNSFIEEKMTMDKSLAKKAIDNIGISSIGGTDIYDAIITSTNLLLSEEAKAIIILSDGQINVGGIDESIKYANKNEVMINTIAIGTKEGGETTYGISKVDEESLKSISHNTGGNFFKASGKEEMSNIFKEIVSIKIKNVSIDISNYMMILAVVLMVVEFSLINIRYRPFV